MDDVAFLRVFDIIVGSLTLAIGIGLFFVPKVVASVEKKLDKMFSTEKLEQMLNQKKNLSQILLSHPRIVGLILAGCSLLLLISAVVVL